jgi:hypothetical protein
MAQPKIGLDGGHQGREQNPGQEIGKKERRQHHYLGEPEPGGFGAVMADRRWYRLSGHKPSVI